MAVSDLNLSGCSHCGRRLSIEVESCPGCGAPPMAAPDRRIDPEKEFRAQLVVQRMGIPTGNSGS